MPGRRRHERAFDPAVHEQLQAQAVDPFRRQLLDALKGQLLIVMVNRLGGRVELPVAEIDATGGWVLNMAVDGGVFTFTTERKQ